MNPKTLKTNVLRVPEKESRGKRRRGNYLEKYWRAEKYLFSHGNKRVSLGPSERAQEKFLEDTVVQLYEASSKHRGRTSMEGWSATEDRHCSVCWDKGAWWVWATEGNQTWMKREEVHGVRWGQGSEAAGWPGWAEPCRLCQICLFPVGTQLALPECCKQGWRWSKICVIVKVTSPAR